MIFQFLKPIFQIFEKVKKNENDEENYVFLSIFSGTASGMILIVAISCPGFTIEKGERVLHKDQALF